MTFLAFVIVKNKYLTRSFIAALFIMAPSWKQPSPSTKEQTNKFWPIHPKIYCSASKENEQLIYGSDRDDSQNHYAE